MEVPTSNWTHYMWESRIFCKCSRHSIPFDCYAFHFDIPENIVARPFKRFWLRWHETKDHITDIGMF
jgi:hypothetical protein